MPHVMTRNLDFAALADAHHLGVWRYLRMLGCNEDDADDLTQEAFVALLQPSFEYRGQGETAAYLRKTARGLFLNRFRGHARLVESGNLDGVAAASEEVWHELAPDDEGNQLRAALERCLETIGGKARDALEMRYGREAARRDIAAHLGLTDAGARTLLQRAKEQLRQCIERRMREKRQ